MENLQVTEVTRTSVTLEWDFDEARATAYMVRRLGPLGIEGVEPEQVLLAACYRGVFHDGGLRPGSRYTYTVELIPPPGQLPDADPDEGTIPVRTQPPTEFPNSVAFFTTFVARTFPRHLDDHVRWCEEWWRHPEAAYVVEQLWCAYEALRPPDPPAFPGKHRAEWLVSYFYPLLDRLTYEDGPLSGCYVPHDRVGNAYEHKVPMKQLPLPHHPDPEGRYRSSG